MPAVNAGNTARNQLMALLGLSAPASVPPQQAFNRFGSDDFRGRYGEAFGRMMQNRYGGFDELGRFYNGRTFTPPTTPTPASDPLDIIRNTPGYEFRLEEGRRALNANRSAGGVSGGELMRDFARFNQGVASDFYRDYANRLANLAGTGQQASTQLGSQGITTGQSIGNSLINAGNARASGIIGQGNAFNQFLGGLAQGFGNGTFSFGGGSSKPSGNLGGLY